MWKVGKYTNPTQEWDICAKISLSQWTLVCKIPQVELPKDTCRREANMVVSLTEK